MVSPPMGTLKPDSLKLSRLGGKLALVRGDLLGVIVAIEPVHPLVALQRSRMQLAFGRRNQIEMPEAVAPPHEPGAHPYRAGEAAMRRDIADADPDPAVMRPVRRR